MPLRLGLHESSLPPPRGTRRSNPLASLVLYDGDALVAWISGRSLGFGGFAAERDAVDAAWVAYAALSRWVGHRRHATPPLPDSPSLSVSADAEQRWVLADELPIARLVDPRSVRADHRAAAVPDGPRAGVPTEARDETRNEARGGAQVGFEMAVPLAVGELGVRSAAYAVYRALCRAGLPWRLWNAGSRARRVGVSRETPDRSVDRVGEWSADRDVSNGADCPDTATPHGAALQAASGRVDS
jgi:hypothetical protein